MKTKWNGLIALSDRMIKFAYFRIFIDVFIVVGGHFLLPKIVAKLGSWTKSNKKLSKSLADLFDWFSFSSSSFSSLLHLKRVVILSTHTHTGHIHWHVLMSFAMQILPFHLSFPFLSLSLSAVQHNRTSVDVCVKDCCQNYFRPWSAMILPFSLYSLFNINRNYWQFSCVCVCVGHWLVIRLSSHTHTHQFDDWFHTDWQ